MTDSSPSGSKGRGDEGHERSPWSSNLSVGEFAAVHIAGFEPAGFALGASVYRFGEQVRGRRLRYKPDYGITGSKSVASLRPMPQHASVQLPRAWTDGYEQIYECQHVGPGHVKGVNYEDRTFEDAVIEAFESARERLRSDVVRLGGHGVVGLRLAIHHPAALRSTAPISEIRLTGTAVRAKGTTELTQPFTSNLSGQAFAKLVSAGWIPFDTRIGIGAIRSYFGCVGSPQDPFGRREFAQRTDAMEMSRELAISRFMFPIDAGVEVRVVNIEPVGPFGLQRDTLFEFGLVGTTVIRYRATTPEPIQAALSLGTR